MRSAAALALLCAGLVLGCGGRETPSTTRKGDLRILPPEVEEPVREVVFDFGGVTTGTSSRATLLLVNVGEDPVRISDVRFEGEPRGAYFVQAPDTVAVDDQAVLELTFSPPAEGAFQTTLVLENDGTGGEAWVQLKGKGL